MVSPDSFLPHRPTNPPCPLLRQSVPLGRLARDHALLFLRADFLVAPVEFQPPERIEAPVALIASGSFFHHNVITRDIKIAGNPGDFVPRRGSAPKGTRTPVLALRGPRPGPLDDGGMKRSNSTMLPHLRQRIF